MEKTWSKKFRDIVPLIKKETSLIFSTTARDFREVLNFQASKIHVEKSLQFFIGQLCLLFLQIEFIILTMRSWDHEFFLNTYVFRYYESGYETPGLYSEAEADPSQDYKVINSSMIPLWSCFFLHFPRAFLYV